MRWRTYPAYRDSGVEWLGEIPEHWSTQRLKFNSYIKGRIGWQNLRGDEFTDAGPYLVTGMHFKDGSVDWDSCYHITEDRYLMAPEIFVQEGDVLITKDGSIGKLAYIDQLPGKASLNSHLLIIRPVGDAYTSRFLYHLLGSELFQRFVVIEQKGTTFYGITQESVESFPAVLPSSDEQHAIAVFLDRETFRLDELIAKKQRQLELLQEKRSALITHVVTKGLDPDVKMKDSGVEWLGEIPEHWEVVPLRGVLSQRQEFNAGPRTSNILSVVKDVGVINYDERQASGNKKSDDIEQYKVIHKGDIVLNRMNVIIGSVGIAKEFGAASIEYYVLHPSDGSVSNEYYGHIFCSRAFQTNLGRLGSGILGHRLRIPYELLRTERLPKPPLSEQQAIADVLNSKRKQDDDLILNVSRSIDLLREYRTALISAAVTGKIDVREEVA